MSVKISVAGVSSSMNKWVVEVANRNFGRDTVSVFCCMDSSQHERVLRCSEPLASKGAHRRYRLVSPINLRNGWIMDSGLLRTEEDDHMLHVLRATVRHHEHGDVLIDTTLRAAIDSRSLCSKSIEAIKAISPLLKIHDPWDM